MAHPATIVDLDMHLPMDDLTENSGQHTARHKRATTRRRRKAIDQLAELPHRNGDAALDLNDADMRRLLSDYAPTEEEPALLRDEGDISPMERRMRARSGHPGVTSVPDTHTSALQPGGKTALLTPCQEIILARRIEKGDRVAKDALVNSNLRLVTSIAQRYQGRGLPMEDLMQE